MLNDVPGVASCVDPESQSGLCPPVCPAAALCTEILRTLRYRSFSGYKMLMQICDCIFFFSLT